VNGARFEYIQGCLLLAGSIRSTPSDNPLSESSPGAEHGWHIYSADPFQTLVQVSPSSNTGGGESKVPAFTAYRH
jgi:hypothetical protein